MYIKIYVSFSKDTLQTQRHGSEYPTSPSSGTSAITQYIILTLMVPVNLLSTTLPAHNDHTLPASS
jgi:hypothetical protein